MRVDGLLSVNDVREAARRRDAAAAPAPVAAPERVIDAGIEVPAIDIPIDPVPGADEAGAAAPTASPAPGRATDPVLAADPVTTALRPATSPMPWASPTIH